MVSQSLEIRQLEPFPSIISMFKDLARTPQNQLRMPLEALSDAFLGFVLVYSQNVLKVYKQVR